VRPALPRHPASSSGQSFTSISCGPAPLSTG
jgi:hypothetical protein